jgi:hypothetical protein
VRNSKTSVRIPGIVLVCLSSSLLHSQAATRPAPSPEKASLGELDVGSDAKTVRIASFPGMLLGGTVVGSKKIVVMTSPVGGVPRLGHWAQRYGTGWILFGNTVKFLKPGRVWIGLLTL